MLRTSTVSLKPTREQEHQLKSLAEASSILWNMANHERRKAFHEHRRFPCYAEQCKIFKDTEPFKRLGTCKAQALLSKLSEAWQSFYTLLRLAERGKLPPHIKRLSPPRYWKRNGMREAKTFYVRGDGWRIDGDVLSVSKDLKIAYQCGGLWVGKQGRLEVQYDDLGRRWYAHIPVEVEWQPPSRTDAKKKASLDLGICNLATLHIKGEKPIIYSGRGVLSDWVYRTKKIAEKQSKLPKRKYTSKSIRKTFRRRQRRLMHAIKAMLRNIFERLEAKNVGDLIIGDLNGIRNNGNHSKNVNQKINNFWAFNLVEKRIHGLREEYGIIIRKIPERDTSNTCCLCGEKHNSRVHRGLILCTKTHRSINADVNGAVNILNVAVKRSPWLETSGSGLMAQPLLLRWNHHEWS